VIVNTTEKNIFAKCVDKHKIIGYNDAWSYGYQREEMILRYIEIVREAGLKRYAPLWLRRMKKRPH
jgi:hypothetical protein